MQPFEFDQPNDQKFVIKRQRNEKFEENGLVMELINRL